MKQGVLEHRLSSPKRLFFEFLPKKTRETKVWSGVRSGELDVPSTLRAVEAAVVRLPRRWFVCLGREDESLVFFC